MHLQSLSTHLNGQIIIVLVGFLRREGENKFPDLTITSKTIDGSEM